MAYWNAQIAVKGKRKEVYLYSAFIVAITLKALRRGSHSFTCKQHHACLSFVCVHQMSPPQQLRHQTSNCSSLLIYRPRKDERLSWPSWLTYSGWLTHISGHPSAASRAKGHRPKTDALPLDYATNHGGSCDLAFSEQTAQLSRPCTSLRRS